MIRWTLPAVLALLAGCQRCGLRDDDPLEPNNTFDQATVLVLGQAAEGRANQNNPDVFAADAPVGHTLVFEARSRGLENCPRFSLHGPGRELLYQDADFRCHLRSEKLFQAPGVELQLLDAEGGVAGRYVLRANTQREGRYFLTIVEQGEADNAFPFSWDYRLVATVE